MAHSLDSSVSISETLGHARVELPPGHYARDLALTSLAEMITHLTSRPAKRLGLYPHRGLVAHGSAADLVLFDPETVKAMATYDEPKVPSRGIRFVLVNGQVALDEGKMVGVRAGRTLRRRKNGKVTSESDLGSFGTGCQ